MITRSWKRKKTRPDDTTGDKRRTRKPPIALAAESTHIDTTYLRKQEVRRVLGAARFLLRKVPAYDDLRTLYELVIQCCKKGHSNDENPFETLSRVKRILETNKESQHPWQSLLPARTELVDVLNTTCRGLANDTLRTNPDLLLLYGNNLFLALLAVQGQLEETTSASFLASLWSAVAEWQLYQMGFGHDTTSDGIMKSKYDLQALYSNLLWRAGVLVSKQRPEELLPEHAFGQLVYNEDQEGFHLWLVIPTKTSAGKMAWALVTGLRSPWFELGWHSTVTDRDILAKFADSALRDGARNDAARTKLGKFEILWGKRENDEGRPEWSVMGMLEFGAPSGAEAAPIRWLKLSSVPSDIDVSISKYVPPEPKSHADKAVTAALREITSWSSSGEHVFCVVSIDIAKEVYKVEFCRDDWLRTPFDSVEVSGTHELVAIFRYNTRTGSSFETRNGNHLLWDHRADVVYSEVALSGKGKDEVLSLSFLRPLVNRASFYPDSYKVPSTCGELLGTKMGKGVKLVAGVDNELRKTGISRCIRLEFIGLPAASRLKQLEGQPMSIYDIALLSECEQIFDTEKRMRHSLSISLKGFETLKIPEGISGYLRFRDVLSGLGLVGEESD